MTFYENLLSRSLLVAAESTTAYEVFTERHLQVVWFEQKYFRPLETTDGKKIEVLSPGIWNTGAGPDFTKAHLKIDDREIRGDIELHLHEAGWAQHGHRNDPNYNEVILHIALWNKGYSATLFKQNNEPVLRVILEPFLTVSLSQIYKLIDLDLYPYKQFLGAGRCAHALFRHLKPNLIENFFHDAARWRLRKKWEFLAYKIESDNDFIPSGYAMALGYKHNTDQFFQLYNALKKHRDLPIEELISLTLGMAGFFEEKYQTQWGESEKFNMLNLLWGGLRPIADHQANLIVHQARPFNHPVRRLANLAYMLADSKTDTLATSFEDQWNQVWPTKKIKEIYMALIGLIPTYTDPYWNSHYIFETTAQPKYLPLIGRDIKKEILVNTILPYLYRKILPRHNWKEQRVFYTLYHWIPSNGNSKTQYLIHRFFGDTTKGSCLSKIDCEQGAYQLHYDFCRHYEASCIGCPFVERYKALKINGG